MIIDHIDNSSRYISGNKNIAAALEFIKKHASDPKLQDGQYQVIPGEVIVHVLTRETHDRKDAKMEIHKNFMDIHYMIKGSERCGVASLSEKIDYDPESDNGFWDCQDDYSIVIGEGEFYAVWPMEPHCPLCNTTEKIENIRKIICKVKIDQ